MTDHFRTLALTLALMALFAPGLSCGNNGEGGKKGRSRDLRAEFKPFDELACKAGLECAPDVFAREFGDVNSCISAQTAGTDASVGELEKACGSGFASWPESQSYAKAVSECVSDAERVVVNGLCPYVQKDFALLDLEKLQGAEGTKPLSENCARTGPLFDAFQTRVEKQCSPADISEAGKENQEPDSNTGAGKAFSPLKLLYSIQGYSDHSGFGGFIEQLGDDNGDGKSDLLMASSKVSHPKGCPAGAKYLLSIRSGVDGSEIRYHCLQPPSEIVFDPYADFGLNKAGDVDGDRLQDVALGFYGDYSVSAYDSGQPCSPSSTCSSGAQCSYYTYCQSTSPCCAVSVPYKSKSGVILFSGRDGSILSAYYPGGKPVSKEMILQGVVGDLNRDGREEAVFAVYETKYNSFTLSEMKIVTLVSGATFIPLSSAFGGSAFPLVDIDKDGAPDFVLSNRTADSHPTVCPGPISWRGVVSIVSGKDGKYLSAICGERDNLKLGYAGSFLDSNGDDYADLLVTVSSGVSAPLRVYSGKDGAKLWESDQNASSGAVVLGDLDGDRVLDVFAMSSSGKLFSGKTGKTLANISETRESSYIPTLLAADVDGDGDPELVFGDPTSSAGGITEAGNISVYDVLPIPSFPQRWPLLVHREQGWSLWGHLWGQVLNRHR